MLETLTALGEGRKGGQLPGQDGSSVRRVDVGEQGQGHRDDAAASWSRDGPDVGAPPLFPRSHLAQVVHGPGFLVGGHPQGEVATVLGGPPT